MSALLESLLDSTRLADCVKNDAEDVARAVANAPFGADLGAIAAYVQALKDHDWAHPMCDEHARWIKGCNELARLRRTQQQIDQDFVLWNLSCHPNCKNGASYA